MLNGKVKIENMDTASLVLLFYSKYSPTCQSLMETINPFLTYRKICVDHPTFRQIILKEQEKYCVRYVPCFFIFYANGVIHKYEGEKAIEWANTILSKLKPLDSASKLPVQIHSKSFLSTEKDILSYSTESSLPEKETVPVMPVSSLSSSFLREKDKNSTESEEEDNLRTRKIDTSPLLDPALRSDASHRMGESHLTERKVMDKKSEHNILNIAQQLQSQREQDDEQVKAN